MMLVYRIIIPLIAMFGIVGNILNIIVLRYFITDNDDHDDGDMDDDDDVCDQMVTCSTSANLSSRTLSTSFSRWPHPSPDNLRG